MIVGITAGGPAAGGPDPGGHRYWRLYHPIGSHDSALFLGIGEVELIGSGGVDLTSDAESAARASANAVAGGGKEAYQAFDDSIVVGGGGNLNYWEAADGAGTWLAWDFGAGNEKAITRVRIYPHLAFPTRMPDLFYVQYSDVGGSTLSDWTTAFTLNVGNVVAQWYDFEVGDGIIYPPTSTTTRALAGKTVRLKLPQARLVGLVGATSLRVGFKAGSSGVTIDACRIGPMVDAVAFTTTPTQMLFGGASGSGAQSAGADFFTDVTAFTVAAATDLMVAFHVSAGGVITQAMRGLIVGERTGSNDTAPLSPSSGYTYPINNLCHIIAIE